MIVVGTVAGTYLSTAGINTTSTNSGVNPANIVDETAPTSSATAKPTASATPGPVRVYATAPALAIDPNKNYTATIKTSKGDITVQLFAKAAPKTVNSFVFLAEHHFYDGLEFDRVVPGFVIQGGDPNLNASGGPGYTLPDEVNSHKNTAGALAMANAGPGTDGSTFYINLVSNPNLNSKYTVFGQVSSGMNVVNAIGATQRDANQLTAPAVKIESISVSTAP